MRRAEPPPWVRDITDVQTFMLGCYNVRDGLVRPPCSRMAVAGHLRSDLGRCAGDGDLVRSGMRISAAWSLISDGVYSTRLFVMRERLRGEGRPVGGQQGRFDMIMCREARTAFTSVSSSTERKD